jgi:DMSO/TMAO reductase YedYZ molybdopterin-dependent catalytic subunit
VSQTKPRKPLARRNILRIALASVGTAMLSACDRLSQNETFVDVLKSAQHLNRSIHKLVPGRKAMAQEFTEADIAPHFRGNGTTEPNSKKYLAQAKDGFSAWKLDVSGLVENPMSFTLADLKALPSRTQITRHDCVEGWSCIGKWKGVPLHQILAMVKPTAGAQYVVFRCADPMDEVNEVDEEDGDESEIDPAKDSTYYESVDMDDAFHAQTILAYELNGKQLSVTNGAPLRLRVERQLGYKQAKYLTKIELVSSFDKIRGGNGGYWEDNGYEWYAGI